MSTAMAGCHRLPAAQLGGLDEQESGGTGHERDGRDDERAVWIRLVTAWWATSVTQPRSRSLLEANAALDNDRRWRFRAGRHDRFAQKPQALVDAREMLAKDEKRASRVTPRSGNSPLASVCEEPLGTPAQMIERGSGEVRQPPPTLRSPGT